MIEVIALDGDDTLWHSEHLFVDTQDRFRDLVRPHVDLDDAALDARLLEVERRNLPVFGYGVKAFTLSLVEMAIEVTDGRIPGADLQAVLDLGKVLIDHPVELLDGVRDAVDELTDTYRVMVITKGDLLHQETKLAASGLGELFVAVEIVSEKDASTYERVFARHGTGAAQAVMAGNSMKSDILPALEAGCWSALIPYPLVWSHEAAEAPVGHARYAELANIGELPGWVESLR